MGTMNVLYNLVEWSVLLAGFVPYLSQRERSRLRYRAESRFQLLRNDRLLSEIIVIWRTYP
jgi:hypothetical protein